MFEGTYLSIDLDFWDCITWDWNDSQECDLVKLSDFRTKLFQEICDRNIPCEWFIEHHHMVTSINKHDCKHIINLDFHSDLTGDGPSSKLNEGNVFDHVIEPKSRTFRWIYPYKQLGKLESAGRCDHARPDAFYHRNWIYGQQNRTCKYNTLKLDNVRRVGVCFSPDWISIDTLKYTEENLLTKFKHPDLEKFYRRCSNRMDFWGRIGRESNESD